MKTRIPTLISPPTMGMPRIPHVPQAPSRPKLPKLSSLETPSLLEKHLMKRVAK